MSSVFEPSPPAPWISQQAALLAHQPSHALLLAGASGLGQFELGLALAQAWLCDTPRPDGNACQRCPSCHAMHVHTHTDFCMLMPEAQLMQQGWPLDERTQKELDEKKRKPSREIRIEAMRQALEFAQRSSGRGRGKVVLIYPAEQMNAICANALLKTLEEPPGQVRFILASEDAHQLLPTIRSRCLVHTLQWPDAAQAQQWLLQQGLDAGQTQTLLLAAGGHPQEALRIAEQLRTDKGAIDLARWHQLPRAAMQGDVSAFAGWSAAQTVSALQKISHDALLIKTGAAPRYFAAADFAESTRQASWQRLTQWARTLMQAMRTMEHPYQAALFQEDMLAQAALALRPPAQPPRSR